MQSHSRSLYNTTQSPGWTDQETKVLKLALMKFGIGQWSAIVHSGVLPGKQITQLSVMTQRIIGQQSLGAMVGLHLDLDKIRRYNEERAKNVTNINVKNGMIINKGHNPTKESKEKENAFYKNQFDLTEKEVAEHVDEFELFSIKRERRLLFNKTVKMILRERKKREREMQKQLESNKASNINENHQNHESHENQEQNNEHGIVNNRNNNLNINESRKRRKIETTSDEQKIELMKAELERDHHNLRTLMEKLIQRRKKKMDSLLSLNSPQ